jgi:hypothetical protein
MRAGLGYTYLLSSNNNGGAVSPLIFGVGSEVARFNTQGVFAIGSSGSPAAATTSKLHACGDITLAATGARSVLYNMYYDTSASQWKYATDGYGWAIRDDNAGKLQVYTFHSGSKDGNATGNLNVAFTIANSGNVGLGRSRSTTFTSNPDTPLTIAHEDIPTAISNTRVTRIAGVMGNFNYLDTTIKRWLGGTDWANTNIRLQRTVDVTPQGFIDFGVDGVNSSQGIGFGSGSTTHMVVNPNGRLGIGEKYPAEALHVSGNIAATGTITASYSDIRLKEKIDDINNSIKIITSLSGFKYKNNDLAKSFGYGEDYTQIGLSAQDVQNVLPEIVTLAPFDMARDENDRLVSRTGNNYLTIDYSKIVPVLIEAIKEQQKIIEKLVVDVEELKRK